MPEFKTIQIARFRSPDGQPTCCANVVTKQTCRFIGFRNFGQIGVCMLGQQRDLPKSGLSFIRPDSKCEVWNDRSVQMNGE